MLFIQADNNGSVVGVKDTISTKTAVILHKSRTIYGYKCVCNVHYWIVIRSAAAAFMNEIKYKE